MLQNTKPCLSVLAIRLTAIALLSITTINSTKYVHAAEPEAAPAQAVDNATSIITDQLKQFDTLLLANKPQDAMALFQRLYRKYTNHPMMMAWAGRIAMMQNNAPAAMEALTAALAKEPDQAMANALMATLEIKTGKAPQGKARLEAALLKHPDSPELLQISAELKMSQFDTAGAISQFQKIADNENNSVMQRAGAFSKIGEIQIKAQKHTEAADALAQALALTWHPQVAAACVQEQYKAQQYDKAYVTYTDFKDKLNKDQRLAQFRTQVLPQFAAIELELNVRYLDTMIKAEDFNSYTVDYRIKEYRKKLDGKTDEASLVLVKLLDDAAFNRTAENFKRHYEKYPENLTWLSMNAKKVIDSAHTVAPEMAAPYVTLANEIIQKYETQNVEQSAAALALAKSGWSLIDFYNPDADKKKILEEKGLYKLKNSYGTVGETLKAYYEPLKAQRKSPAFEELALQYIQTPGDLALKRKLADALYEHIRDLDIATEKDAAQKVLPGQVWSVIPGTVTSPGYSKEVNDKSESAYSLWSNFKVDDPMQAHRWKELTDGYDRIINLYPKPGALIGRAKVQLYAGNYRQAFEDQAAAVAVAAWERAHTFMYSSALRGTLDVNGVPTVQQFHDIMTGKGSTSGLYASAPLVEVMKNIQSKNWAAIGPFLLVEHDKHSFAKQLANDMRWGPKLYRVEILNGLAKKWANTKDKAQQEIIKKQAEVLSAGTHPAFGLLKYEDAKDDDGRITLLESIIRNTELGGNYDPAVNFLLASLYEKKGQTMLARLQYNAGASGLQAADLKNSEYGLKCAARRDALEGTTETQKIYDLYYADMKDFQSRSGEIKGNVVELVRWYGVLNRVLVLSGDVVGILSTRFQVFQRMRDYARAIADLEEILKRQPTAKKATIAAYIGYNSQKLGDYDRAIAEYTKAIDGDFKEEWIYASRGELYRSAGQAEKAIADYSEVLKINPENKNALTERADLYEWYVNNDVAALADFEKLLELRKKNPAKADDLLGNLGDDSVTNFRIANLKMKIAKKKLNGTLGN